MKKEIKKSVKYGSLSAVFVAVVLVVVVLINVMITLVQKNTSLSIDLTNTGIYTISEAAKEFISDINTPITIYICKEKDRTQTDSTTFRMVWNLIEEFDKEYDYITVEYIDIDKNKALVDKWNKESGTTITSNSIIVSGEQSGQFRHLLPPAFFSTASSTGLLYAFKGEITLTTALIQVSGENRPKIAFTTGHSENTNNAVLRATFDEAGFDVVTVDLSKEEIPEGTKIIFICNPQYDFLGLAAEEAGEIDAESNEIDKLAKFMLDFNHVIVTVDPSTPELPELKDFLLEYGLYWTPKAQVIDTSKSLTGALTNGRRIIGKFVSDNTDSAAYQAHKSISTLQSPPRVIFENVTPLVLSKPTKSGYNVFPSITSYPSSQIYKDELPDAEGEFPLLAVSSSSKYIGEAGEQVLIYSTVTLSGSTDFISDSYINERFGNKEIMYSLARMMGSRRVPNGLDFKILFDEALTIDQTTAETLTIVLSVVAPTIVAIIGFAVFLKRRHL